MGSMKKLFYIGVGSVMTYLAVNGGCQCIQEHFLNGKTADGVYRMADGTEMVLRYCVRGVFGADKAKPEQPQSPQPKPKSNGLEDKLSQPQK